MTEPVVRHVQIVLRQIQNVILLIRRVVSSRLHPQRQVLHLLLVRLIQQVNQQIWYAYTFYIICFEKERDSINEYILAIYTYMCSLVLSHFFIIFLTMIFIYNNHQPTSVPTSVPTDAPTTSQVSLISLSFYTIPS